MRIYIGTYSLKIKKYNYKELELDNNYKDVNFHLLQKVFYIFFIPILPLGKFWKIKNIKTNENVTTDAALRTKLNIVALKKKNPLWSYTGSIILLVPVVYLLGTLIFNIGNDVFNEYQKKTEKKAINSKIINRINHPILNDIYLIKMIEMDPNIDANGKVKGFTKGYKVDLEYQLINLSKDSIELEMIAYPKYDGSGLVLEKKFNTSKTNLINIADRYKTINLYKKGTEYNPDLEAVFSIKEINRHGE